MHVCTTTRSAVYRHVWIRVSLLSLKPDDGSGSGSTTAKRFREVVGIHDPAPKNVSIISDENVYTFFIKRGCIGFLHPFR